jgi:hypothetical protein
MQEPSTPRRDESLDQVESAIHALLVVADEQRPWSVHEVELEIGDPAGVEDALTRLHASGLVHRCGGFAWATRAALAADKIAL